MKKQMKKQILNKLADLNDKNEGLYKKKTEFEEAILKIDIEIYKLAGEYDLLIKDFLSTQQMKGEE